MKVGTDGVLLGAWSTIFQNDSVLDIGTGSGLIALMLAQRGGKLIDAVEIDLMASEQAKENFLRSPWQEKLNAHCISITSFKPSVDEGYDLIVTNPPFFESNELTDERNIARAQNKLTHSELIHSVSELLHKNGRFTVVLPFQITGNFIEIAAQKKLLLTRRCEVKGMNALKPSRVLLQFEFKELPLQKSSLTIETTKRHEYSEEYRELMADYLTIF